MVLLFIDVCGWEDGIILMMQSISTRINFCHLDKFRKLSQNDSMVKLPIRADQRKGLPFSLKSRNGIAIVLGFFGDNEQVGDLM